MHEESSTTGTLNNYLRSLEVGEVYVEVTLTTGEKLVGQPSPRWGEDHGGLLNLTVSDEADYLVRIDHVIAVRPVADPD